MADKTEVYRVFIQFAETKIIYLSHLATEVQERGYRKDRLYNGLEWWKDDKHQLTLITEASSPEEAEERAKALLLKYLENS